MVATKRENRKRSLLLILGSLGAIALIALASALGWIEGGTTLAGSGGNDGGLAASRTAGGGSEGGGSESGGSLAGVSLGAGPAKLSGSADRGCLLGFICVDSSAEVGENQAGGSIDEDGASVDN